MEQEVKWYNMAVLRDSSSFQCSECEVENAVNICTDCPSMKLCESCTNHHKRCAKYKHHSVQTLEGVSNEELCDDAALCSEHGLELKLFCETCQVVVCVDCIASHLRHPFVPLDRIVGGVSDQLQKSLSKSDQVFNEYEGYLGAIEEFERKAHESSKKDVEEAFDELMAVLLESKTSFLAFLDTRFQSSTNKLKSVKEKISHLKSMCDHFKEVKRHPKENIVDILKSGVPMLTKKLECIQEVAKTVSEMDSIEVLEGLEEQDGKMVDRLLLEYHQLKTSNEFLVNTNSYLRVSKSSYFADLKSLLTFASTPNFKKVYKSKLIDGFDFFKYKFPSPAKSLTLKVKDLSGSWECKSSSLKRMDLFYWTIGIEKTKNMPFDERNKEAAWFISCDPMGSSDFQWECRADYSLMLRNFSTGASKNLTRRNGVNFWDKCNTQSTGFNNLSMDELVREGFVKNGVMQVYAVIKILSRKMEPSVKAQS